MLKSPLTSDLIMTEKNEVHYRSSEKSFKNRGQFHNQSIGCNKHSRLKVDGSTLVVRFYEFGKQQARKGFRPLSAMQGIRKFKCVIFSKSLEFFGILLGILWESLGILLELHDILIFNMKGIDVFFKILGQSTRKEGI